MKESASRLRGGFTLTELLLVVAIMVVLMSVTLPAFTSIAMGTNLSRAGQLIGDQISLARQEAMTRNRDVRVQFFPNLVKGGVTNYGVQIFRVEEGTDGEQLIPASRMVLLPAGLRVNDNLSPLTKADAALSGSMTNVAQYGTVQSSGFKFRPNGAPGSAVNAANNFLTLQRSGDPGDQPDNFYTIQINPVTGKVTVYRP